MEEERIRQMLRDHADDVPAHRPTPSTLRPRARRRTALVFGLAALAVAALVAGTMVGVSRFQGSAHPRPAHTGPSPLPAYHHNGNLLTVANGQLQEIDPATGSVEMLPNAGPWTDLQPLGAVFHLAVSPDGTKVAYAASWLERQPRGSAATLGVYVLDLNSGRATRIAPCGSPQCSFFNFVSWSPDGSRITYASDGRIIVMDTDGGHVRQLVQLGGALVGQPSWSPDGRMLAFTATSTSHASDPLGSRLYVVGSDGSGLTVIQHRPGLGIFDAAWSPDGSEIAFRVWLKGTNAAGPSGAQLWVVRPDGSERRMLFESRGACGRSCGAGPVWSPDGAKIAYVDTQNHIVVMHADGSDPHGLPWSMREVAGWAGVVWLPVP